MTKSQRCRFGLRVKLEMTAERALAIAVLSHIYSRDISVPLVSDFPGHVETNQHFTLTRRLPVVARFKLVVPCRAVQGVRSDEIRRVTVLPTVHRARSLLDGCFTESAASTVCVPK